MNLTHQIAAQDAREYEIREAMNNITTPTVMMIGTPPAVLIEGYSFAYEKTMEAIMALESSPPHARDYYHQGAEAVKKAHDEHAERVERLTTTLHELAHIINTIAQQATR